MSSATSSVIKPTHDGTRKHFLFTDEHLDLRESMSAWVKKEMFPHRNEWEDTYWPTEIMQRVREAGLRYVEVPITISYSEYSQQKGQRLSGSLSILFDLIMAKLTK